METKKMYHTIQKCSLVIILAFTICSKCLNSQNTVHHFTIETFVTAVKENNIQLKIAESAKKIALEGKNEAWAAFLPQVNFQGTYQRNFTDQKMYIEFPDFGSMNPETGEIPVTLQKFNVGFNNDFQANLLLEQNILSLKSIYELKAARIYSEIGSIQFEQKTDEILSNARKMFLQTVLMKHVYELDKLTEQNAFENYTITKNKFDNKLIAEIDLLQSKIRWENEIPKTRQAKRNYLILLNNLKIISGLNTSDSLSLEHQFSFQEDAGTLTSMEDIYSNRKDYQMLNRNIELQMAFLNKEKAEYLPTITGQLGYSYLSNSDKWKYDEHVNKPFYAGLTLTIPIISGGYRNSQVRKAMLKHDIANYQLDNAKQEISIEIQNLKLKLQEESTKISSAQSTLETAQKGYELAERNIETGLISQLDLRRYSEDLKKAQLNLYYAIFNYECSLIDYDIAIGKNE